MFSNKHTRLLEITKEKERTNTLSNAIPNSATTDATIPSHPPIGTKIDDKIVTALTLDLHNFSRPNQNNNSIFIPIKNNNHPPSHLNLLSY